MNKFITAMTTAIALTACEGNKSNINTSEFEQLPLTYQFDEKEPNSYIAFTGNIIFDKGCFYSDFLGSRMAIVFPDKFKWDQSSSLIKADSKTITPGQKISAGAVLIDRKEFKRGKLYFSTNEACLTEKLILLHGYFS